MAIALAYTGAVHVRWSNCDLPIYGLPESKCFMLARPGACSALRSIAVSWAVHRDLPRLAGGFNVTSSKRSHEVDKLCSRSADYDPQQVHAERFSSQS